jgi:hypothetical protein
MEYQKIMSRDYTENEKGQKLGTKQVPSWKFWKMGLVSKNEGNGQHGRLVGNYVTAEIEVGRGPRQVTVEDLEDLLESGGPIVAPTAEQRGNKAITGPKIEIALGSGEKAWSPAEIKEIIAMVEGEKPKRGRPKKDDGKTNSGNGPAGAGSTDSSGDES